jgi:hypothetical protein
MAPIRCGALLLRRYYFRRNRSIRLETPQTPMGVEHASVRPDSQGWMPSKAAETSPLQWLACCSLAVNGHDPALRINAPSERRARDVRWAARVRAPERGFDEIRVQFFECIIFPDTGWLNLAASMGTFVSISFNWIASRPSSHAKRRRNGILTPFTSR